MRKFYREVSASVVREAGQAPKFVISTNSRNATDNNIVLQYWDLSRQDTVGIPVLDSHDTRRSIGNWTNLRVETINGVESLTGEIRWNPHEPLAIQREKEFKDEFLNAVSVRWIPGFQIRRSELPKDSPYYAPPSEDECGYPNEGYLMGSAEVPNRMLEASTTFLPADDTAVALRNALVTPFGTIPEGPVAEENMRRMLRLVRNVPGVPRYLGELFREIAPDIIRAIIIEELKRAQSPTQDNPANEPNVTTEDEDTIPWLCK